MQHPPGCACEICFPKMLRLSELRAEASGLARQLPQSALEEAIAYLRDLADREASLEATSR